MSARSTLLVCLFLGLIIGCSPSVSENPGEEVLPERTPEPDDLGLRIRVVNETPERVDKITLRFVNSEVTFSGIATGEASDYQLVTEAYQSVAAELGEGERQILIDQALEEGEPAITTGNYSYILQAGVNFSDAYLDLRPDLAQTSERLLPLIHKLETLVSEIEFQPSIQRGTPFDAAYGETISGREIVLLDGVRTDVFYFANEAMASLMAEGIAAGGTQLTIERTDGELISQSLQSVTGVQANWWQSGRFLVLYSGNNGATIAALGSGLGTALVAQEPGITEIRIANIGQIDFESVQVNFAGETIDYGPVARFGMSAYMPVAVAYRYGSIMIESEAGPFDLVAIDYVGETPLVSGRYTYYLGIEAGELVETMIADDDWHVPTTLIEQDYFWLAGSGPQQPAADLESEQGDWPYIRFADSLSPNDGEAGLQFWGFTGCNGMGGTYFSNPYQAVVITGIGQNAAGCMPEVMASEAYFTAYLTGINYYYQVNDWLFLTHGSSDRLVLGPNRPEAADIAPLLLDLWPAVFFDEIDQLSDASSEDAAEWELIIFTESVQVTVFAEEGTFGNIELAEGAVGWVTGRYLITYAGDDQLIQNVLDEVLGDPIGE